MKPPKTHIKTQTSMAHAQGCPRLDSLKYDEACFEVAFNSSEKHGVKVLAQTAECYLCDLEELGHLPAKGGNHYFKINNTAYPLKFAFVDDRDDQPLCHLKFHFEEHGLYRLNISNNTCSPVETIEPPHNIYSPFLHLIGAYVICLILYQLFKCSHVFLLSWRSRSSLISSEIRNDLGSVSSGGDSAVLLRTEPPTPQKKNKARVKALDAFRGIAICLMMFVNYGGGKYWFFKHSAWNGLTFADLVFPWFTWIMGVGIAISLRSQLRACVKRKQIFISVLRRACVLIILGVILNSQHQNDLSQMRLPGVLQRLGLAYFIVASIETCFMEKQTVDQNSARWIFMPDMLESRAQWFVVKCLLGTYFLIILFLPVPGCPTGYFGPGGLHNHSAFFNCTGGATGYIDRLVFGENHLYQRPTSAKIYKSTIPFDPEGLLGVIPTVFLMFLGVQAGRILHCYQSTDARVKRWIFWSVLTVAMAAVQCKFAKEGGYIPINKNLWSFSFVLVTASSAFFIFFALSLLIDHFQLWSGTPFRQAGMNAILLYVGHDVTHDVFPWSWKPHSVSSHFEFLFMNVWATALWMLIAFALHKKGFFITI
ncbi:unnamed protein product [Bemisia tabaci]|uniref:Heparan-alpha-glucosaminide N-acetyltransferase n=1 Tax=Bemisia tabaci TaxID=7038 RepID=A0A9P0A8P2_BEMTA|nr:unnamed protein product [Bemisia tabaci]